MLKQRWVKAEMNLEKKILILGSVVSPCPPKKQGGTEKVAYYQAKHLAKKGLKIIFVGAVGTKQNFSEELEFEKENAKQILVNIEFVEIGGGTQFGFAEDALKLDPSRVEASRKLRLEMANLAKVQTLMIKRQKEYEFVLNNMRGEAVFLPLAQELKKRFVCVMHLNLFPELAELFSDYQTPVITIANHQKKQFPGLNYLSTINNPVNPDVFKFKLTPKNYALMMSTIGYHKNQEDAIIACKKAEIPLVLAGKIRDKDYFEKSIKPFVDGRNVIYYGEMDFMKKLKLYQEAKVFLFPIKWQEPFGLVVIEALSCGVPVIAYPHGGPAEIVKDGKTGFLVNSPEEMATKIKQIDSIKRENCRKDVEENYSDKVIGEQYYQALFYPSTT